jgi:DNA polymerase-3 subunit delta'
MHIPEIVGQDEAVRLLDREMASGKMSHAYLLWGPRGSGKMTLAKRLALAANCIRSATQAEALGEPESDQNTPLWYCGECPNCEKILKGVHPDFCVVAPEGDAIKIGQIREMKWRIALKPNEASIKTWIIDDADRMTEEAQNCLLKVLEEPPGDSLIILLSEDPGMMLPTISSRCHEARLNAVGIEELAEWAEAKFDLEPERAKLLAVLSHGLPGRVATLVRDDEYFKVRDRIISTVREVALCGDGSKALAASEDLLDQLKKAYAHAANGGGSPEASEISSPMGACDLMAGWFRDLFVLSITGDESLIINLDHIMDIREGAGKGKPSLFSRWAVKAMQTAQALRSSANPRLAMDDLFLNLALPE